MSLCLKGRDACAIREYQSQHLSDATFPAGTAFNLNDGDVCLQYTGSTKVWHAGKFNAILLSTKLRCWMLR
jgi:hypothetical protein